jgi:hypothetical protein
MAVVDSDFSPQDQRGRIRSCVELQTAAAKEQVKSPCLKVTPLAPRKTMYERCCGVRELQPEVRLTVILTIYCGDSVVFKVSLSQLSLTSRRFFSGIEW